ncbi:MAG: pseudouridylate synthase [Bacteroidales bacterium]|nr:pseudouridylate synthase [Bacteroidales bacterium]
MRIDEIDILEVLPQRPPFCFVDRMLSYEEPDIVTEYTVKEDCVFLEQGQMRASGLVEVMAQSSAARVGYINKFIKKLDVNVGFIGSVKGLKIYRCPLLGETMVTKVELKQEIFSISMVQATVCIGGEKIAEATLKTVEVE